VAFQTESVSRQWASAGYALDSILPASVGPTLVRHRATYVGECRANIGKYKKQAFHQKLNK